MVQATKFKMMAFVSEGSAINLDLDPRTLTRLF